MKRTRLAKCIVLSVLCVLTLLSLVSCLSADMEVGNHTELADQFVTHVINGDYNSAYGMVSASAGESEFREYWEMIRTVADGSKSYKMEQIGWNINSTNGVTTNTTAHQVYLDNGKTVLLRVVTQENVEGIAGIHFSDVTDFLQRTDRVVPVVNIVLIVVSVLTYAFAGWMLVDCIRRKIKYKAVWIILILACVSFTLTIGDQGGFNFMVGLILQRNSIVADPGLRSVVTKIVGPVGALVYLFVRKKITVNPEEQTEPVCVPNVDETTDSNESDV